MPQRALLILSLLLGACSAPTPDYVVVKATGSVTVPIDFVTIAISFDVEEQSLGQAYAVMQKHAQTMFGVFRSFGISDSDFVTTQSSTSVGRFQPFVPSSGKSVRAAQYSGQLTLRRIDQYDALVRSLLAKGPFEIRLRSTKSNTPEHYVALAQQQAVSTARAIAEKLASGSARRVGRVIKILQGDKDPYDLYDRYDLDDDMEARNQLSDSKIEVAEAPPPGPTTFRRTTFQERASLTVIFALD